MAHPARHVGFETVRLSSDPAWHCQAPQANRARWLANPRAAWLFRSVASPAKLALVAFVGHAPGLWIVARCRLSRGMRLANVLALAGTSVTMLAVALGSSHPMRATLITWFVGHFGWSAVLAPSVYRSAARKNRGVNH